MKNILLGGYVAILLVPGITWVRGLSTDIGTYDLMRLAGLYAFTLVAVQIGVGSLIRHLRLYFGAGILKFHIIQGSIAFGLAWAHPVFYALTVGWSAVLNSTNSYEVLGKLGLMFLTAGVTAGALRSKSWFMKYWRWIHRVNYLTLVIIYIHSWKLGSDVSMWPMRGIYLLLPIFVVCVVGVKVKEVLRLRQEKNLLPTSR